MEEEMGQTGHETERVEESTTIEREVQTGTDAEDADPNDENGEE